MDRQEAGESFRQAQLTTKYSFLPAQTRVPLSHSQLFGARRKKGKEKAWISPQWLTTAYYSKILPMAWNIRRTLMLLKDQNCWWEGHTQALRAVKPLILWTRRTRWARSNARSKKWHKPQFALGRKLQIFMHSVRRCFWHLRESGNWTYQLAKGCDLEPSRPCGCSLELCLPVFKTTVTWQN